MSEKSRTSINGTYGSSKFGSEYKSCCCEQFSDQQLKKIYLPEIEVES